MSKPLNLETQPAGAAAPRPPAPPAEPDQWYRVISADKRIPQQGGDFVLRQGSEIRGSSYNHIGGVKRLQALGVELKAIDPPGWFRDASESAA